MRNSSIFSVVILSVIFLLSCSTSPTTTKKTKSPPQPTLSAEQKQVLQETQDEIAVGKAMAAKIMGTYGVYEDPNQSVKYVKILGASLAKQFGRPELKYYFEVLDTDDMNAYATPGGYIFITKGLLKQVKSESELATILCHEIAHINRKHMYKDIMPKREVSTGESLTRILSRGAADIGKSLAQAVNNGLEMLLEKGLTHDYEYDADQVGVEYASAAGYNPASLKEVLKRIKAVLKAENQMSTTHPPFEKRFEAIDKTIAQNGLETTVTAKSPVLESRFAQFVEAFK